MRTISMRRAWSLGVDTLFADKKLAATYLVMAIIIPLLFFSVHDLSNFRAFYALATDSRVFVATTGSIWTIASLFLFSLIALNAVAMAAWNAMLASSRDGVIGEVMYGLIAGIISFFVAAIIYVAINLPFSLINLVVGMAAGAGTVATISTTAVVGLANLALLLWFNARLSMTGPTMAAMGSLNPFPAMVQSWQITGQAQWRVIALLFVCQIIGFVALTMFLTGAVLLIQDTYDYGWQDRVITAGWLIVELGLAALFLIVSTGLYLELTDRVDAAVFE